MKKYLILLPIVVIAVLSMCMISANADTIEVMRVPPGFSANLWFSGSGASRKGTCQTLVTSPRGGYRADVDCEMQNNAGQTIDIQSAYGADGGWGSRVETRNWTQDTGRLVLFSTHRTFVNVQPDAEFRMIESNGN